jgi:osmotically-inducible protein OsmY
MQQIRRYAVFPLMGCFAMSFLLGCSPETVQSAKQDVERNTKDIRDTVEKVEKVTKPIAEVAQPLVKPVAEAVKKEADEKVEQLKLGARVTTALKVNLNLPQTIRVDADDDGKGVKLRGTVETKAQKQLAEKVAKETLGKGFRVQNDLTIEPQKPAKATKGTPEPKK